MLPATADRWLQELTAKTRAQLRGWKEVVVLAHSVSVWSQAHHPPLLAASVSALFLLIWLLDASVLTTMSVLGLLLTLADYVVPLLSASLFDARKFGEAEEAVYARVCSDLAQLCLSLRGLWRQWTDLKDTKPVLYSFLLLTSLLMMAYIGSSVNNLFLIYLIVLSVVMLPGLRAHGIIQQLVQKAVQTVKDLVGDRLKKTR